MRTYTVCTYSPSCSLSVTYILSRLSSVVVFFWQRGRGAGRRSSGGRVILAERVSPDRCDRPRPLRDPARPAPRSPASGVFALCLVFRRSGSADHQPQGTRYKTTSGDFVVSDRPLVSRFHCPLSSSPLHGFLTLIITRLPAGLLCREPWASLACAAGPPGEVAASLCAPFGTSSAPRTDSWRLPHTEGHGRTHASRFVRGSARGECMRAHTCRRAHSARVHVLAHARAQHTRARARARTRGGGGGRGGAAHRDIGTPCRTRSSLEHSTPPRPSGWPSDAFRRRPL